MKPKAVFQKINIIDKPLARLAEKERERENRPEISISGMKQG